MNMAITDEIPKSRLTLTYRTNVNGQLEDKQLPFRLLIMGDLSNGTSKDRALELDQRNFRHLDGRNLNSVMADMKMSMQFSVDNRVDPDRGDIIDVTLPIHGMKSFSPAQIAEQVPKLKALLLLKKLLLEVQNNIDNRKEFRNLLRQIAESPDLAAALRQELAGYDDFKLPAGTDGGAPAAPPAAPDKLAAEKAEQERRAKAAAEKAEAERRAALKAEEERRAKAAAEKAEAERRAALKAEEERRAKEAAEKAEAEKLAAEKAEAERLAAEKAEAERLAAEKAEAERLAAEKAEAERLAAESAAAPEAAGGDPEAPAAGPETGGGDPEAGGGDPEAGGGDKP
jgi:type VI secretion system protein ImpB